jgi:hypothetical protein
LRFDPLPEDILKSRLKKISDVTEPPGKFDVKLRRSDLRYFLLNPQKSRSSTVWLTTLLNLHPKNRLKFWKKCYNEMSLQTFGCHILSLSLLTNTGFPLWKEWVQLCDPNLSTWVTEDSSVTYMEQIWSGFTKSF